ncbi:MAG: DNTP-hexose dehydratase/epimerase [Candidatus Gottesmanbacteria bacterium GW2011_GWA1_44_24b]|uniref:DNTP-hexose dehydratase/epimerase n=1 Tax=Candidatus Gottesmanbacteria bacterium GW2011_GWA1_44_24b TaxID=1618437 RepID=A0A0G1IIC5_9BACT|nr:MAG: DNTP-hexose dehydratase/epimerase [Candidatus Gottesmanbacteria bacterium GW2011_GWA1_44_24b]
MKLLVFGGVGFIGTNVCLTALSRGYQVIACDNLSRTGVVENLAYGAWKISTVSPKALTA